jgi:formylglycine-generating enzyme required for sulfatase activity
LQIGETDYIKEQANLAMLVSVAPSEAGFAALNALLEGLEKTGKREAWGFSGWPLLDIPKAPEAVLFPGKRSFSYAVQAGLVNENGKIIARGKVTLNTGALSFRAGDRSINPPEGAFGRMDFPNVNAADLTPILTVVIAGVNGMSGRQISETGYMRIAPGNVKQKQEEAERLNASFVRVPGGTFRMGSDNGDSDEKPVHTVTVSAFYMGKTEVTQKEYQALMGNNPSSFKGDNLPVETVTWLDAVAYCNARSRKEGLSPAYTINGETVSWNRSANGYRLPTEAEWEYAAKGGGKDSFEYSGGNSVDSVAWYSGNSGNKTHPVGTKQPNSLGLYDMSGNVWEWCWDWYDSYSSGNQTDPTGASSGTYRVTRGGSWGNDAALARSAYRDGDTPSGRYYDLGFRLVASSL